MNWDAVVTKVTPHIVKIETPDGHGTGFLCLYNDLQGEQQPLCGIATAHHVVGTADTWQQPIRVHHFPTGKTAFLKDTDRLIFPNAENDSAVILFPRGKLELPEHPIQLLPTDVALPIGVEVGWLGYPGVERNTLCFFSGNVSARRSRGAYLIDGVSIHGISGGPVIYSTPDNGVQIVGAISAYIVNRATGEALPGLAIAQDVSHFYAVAAHIKSIDEERKKQAQQPPPLEPPPAPEQPSTATTNGKTP
jgi:hypothetical protein